MTINPSAGRQQAAEGVGGGPVSPTRGHAASFVTNPPSRDDDDRGGGGCIHYIFTGLTRALSLFPAEGLKKQRKKEEEEEELRNSCI